MIKNLGLSIFFGLIFITSLAFAQDFGVSVDITPKETTINLCDVTFYDITIENTGAKSDTYSIDIKGLPENWYSLSQNTVKLNPGESETVYLFVTASCNDGKGVYSGSVTVKGQVEDTETFKLIVVADRSVRITLPKDTASCLCDGGFIKAKIENTGKYREELIFSLTSEIAEYLSLEKTSMTLEPGQIDYLDIMISDVCKPEGKYSLKLSTEAKKSYVTAEAETQIDMTKCYQFKASMPKELSGCDDETNYFNIDLKNIGLKSDEYTIKIEDLNYTKTVKLDPEKDTELKISFVKDVGKYEIEVVVKSDTQTEIYNVYTTIEKCYDASLVIEEDKYETFPCQGKLIKAVIKNKGTKSDTYNIDSDKSWVVIKPKTIELDPAETGDVSIYCSPAYDMEGEYNIKVTAESKKVSLIETFVLNVLGKGITTTVPEETTTMPVITLPEETTTTAECRFYYWLDNEQETCGYKEFCGEFMYEGLMTFDTLEECVLELTKGGTTTTKWTIPNVTISFPFEEKIPGMKVLKPLVIALLIAFIVLGGLYWLVMKGE